MLGGLTEDVLIVVDVEVEIGMVFLGQPDTFIIDQAAVLDSVDSGENRVFDRLCAVSMRGNFAS